MFRVEPHDVCDDVVVVILYDCPVEIAPISVGRNMYVTTCVSKRRQKQQPKQRRKKILHKINDFY